MALDPFVLFSLRRPHLCASFSLTNWSNDTARMTRLASDEFNAEVAIRLAALRASTGLSQAKFAESVGLAERSYINYERGEREIPASVLRRMLEVYGVDPVWILAGSGDEPEYASQRRFDERLMMQVFQIVGDELKRAKKTFTFAKYSKFLCLAYQHAVEDGEVNSKRLRELIRLTA